MDKNIAILWDIENVTPGSTDNLFVQSLMDYAESLGRVVTSYAYADWSKPGFRSLGPILATYNFFMLHVPYKKVRSNKNGSDMQLVSDAFDLLRFFQHIDTYMLITGDSDFRPLLRSLRKSGKEIHIVCDFKTASKDLLEQADSFKDYRELRPDEDDDDAGEDDQPSSSGNKINMNREYWYERLAESAAQLQRDQKTCNMGTVKIQMKILNRGFDEKKLGFRQWSNFIAAAVKAGYVTLNEYEKGTEIFPGKGYEKNREKGSLQGAFRILIETLQELDNGGVPGYHRYSVLSTRLKEKNVNTRDLGFTKFKLFISSAEARGLVETKVEAFSSYLKRQI
ncbi:MAG: NYN domain-containing protein [Spirochaetales bacterium]|nr:NYN domain-containing protein [Spirochaetales bacterium]